MLDAILRYWNLAEARDLIPRVYRSGLKPADFADLAPLVIRVSEGGDQVARRLIERASESLVDTIIAVVERLSFQEEEIPLALAGGLLLRAAWLRANLLTALERCRHRFAPIVQVDEPVIGAVRLAVELLRNQ